MRYYGIRKKRNTDDILYQGFKLRRKLNYLVEFNKEEKKRKKENYKYEFSKEFQLERSNQIPEGNFYEPVSIIATDLIAKENINKLKSGLRKIISKYSTKKFLGNFWDVNEINRNVESLNEYITDAHSWVNLGRFDFSSHPKLDKEISYFDIKILNFSSSFIAIQCTIFLANDRQKELIDLIRDDYMGNSQKITPYYRSKNNKAGARKGYTISNYNKDSVKNIKINEFITEIKWILFNQLTKYIPTILHGLGTIPPSVNIIKTNIDFNEDNNSSFIYSIGYESTKVLPISNDTRLIIDPSNDYINNRIYSDYTYVVNTNLKEEKTYISLENEITFELEHLYFYLIRTHILKVMSIQFHSVSSKYRNKINNVKIKKQSYKKLLNLRYTYEKDTNIFKRLFDEIDWKHEEERLSSFDFEYRCNLERPYTYAYSALTEYPFTKKEEIEKYHNYIKNEIDNKLNLTNNLKSYKDEGRNLRLNVINILISTITFCSLLYPSIPKNLANQLKKVILLFSTLLQ